MELSLSHCWSTEGTASKSDLPRIKMESPVGTAFGGASRNKLTPGRKTPSRWKTVTSPYAVYTSTPLNSPGPSCLMQLLEWEASAVLGDSRTATPFAIRSPNVSTPVGSRSGVDKTPTANSSRLFRRRINRRILESSTNASEVTTPAHPLSPAASPCGHKDEPRCGPGPVRNIQRQRAMVKRFMVTREKLRQCRIVNDNRGGLRL